MSVYKFHVLMNVTVLSAFSSHNLHLKFEFTFSLQFLIKIYMSKVLKMSKNKTSHLYTFLHHMPMVFSGLFRASAAIIIQCKCLLLYNYSGWPLLEP